MIRSSAVQEPLLVRPDARGREPLGREERRGELGRPTRLDRVDLGDDPVEREQLGVGDQRLAEPVHPGRRRLHREQDPALQVLLRALELARRQVAGRDVGDLLGRDRERVGEVVLARAEVDADLAGVGVLRDERVDGVRHATLLANLLEEPGRRGAAEDRIEERRCEPPPVGARDPGRREADVVLLGVLALEAEVRRRRPAQGRPQVRLARARCAALVERSRTSSTI